MRNWYPAKANIAYWHTNLIAQLGELHAFGGEIAAFALTWVSHIRATHGYLMKGVESSFQIC